MDEEIRHTLLVLNVDELQEAIDEKNLIKGGSNFFEDAAAKFSELCARLHGPS
jgi:hypothetical protein